MFRFLVSPITNLKEVHAHNINGRETLVILALLGFKAVTPEQQPRETRIGPPRRTAPKAAGGQHDRMECGARPRGHRCRPFIGHDRAVQRGVRRRGHRPTFVGKPLEPGSKVSVEGGQCDSRQREKGRL